MGMVLLFVVLPVALMVLAWRIKPLIGREHRARDPLGGGLVGTGFFGGHGLEPDAQVQREDTEPVRFDLSGLRRAERKSE